MEYWYKLVTPRKEVREGRSFNPDEFAIHLEQVVAGTAPEDYRNPKAFFQRTCFTRALREHTGMVLRRLAGQTNNTAPVMTLMTRFGGGKTHTLTTLYHLANTGAKANQFEGISELLLHEGLTDVPKAKVAVFVGNAFDPQPGKETPWIDLARQLAGDRGIEILGPSAKSSPPGTETLTKLFEAAGGSVLILCDEVLNFVNRHRGMAEPFHAFLQNLTVATTGLTRSAAVLSLPKSKTEMTDWDMEWQKKFEKVVRRVGKDLLANDESEIGEVLRRRLFDDLGSETKRKNIAKAYADWVFDLRAQLPPEWTAVDSTATEKTGKEFLRKRFEDSYPFHPATISVFQRKWQALPQYQQTRGTLAMLAQWISKAMEQGYKNARSEPLITLGSAPLEVPEFRSIVLGQVGEGRLNAAIDCDISGDNAHSKALDADTKGELKDIHRRVATAIFFESTGGQSDKVAHLPELRFALGEPGIDTTSIDNAAYAMEAKGYYIRRQGTDGFRIHHQPTLKKVMSDRKASLDEATEIRPQMRAIVQKQFEKGATLALTPFPPAGDDVNDTAKLSLVLIDPETEWTGSAAQRKQIAEWMTKRSGSNRLYPAATVYCFRKPGRAFREKVENWLAWKRVSAEVVGGQLAGEFDAADKADIRARVSEAEEATREEVWGSYSFIAFYDAGEADSLRVINLGLGHSSSGEPLCTRVLKALKTDGRLNDGISAGFLERNWPQALKGEGIWPLVSLRQCFLNGALTRLIDPDATLKQKLAELVEKGELGLGSGQNPDGTFVRCWYREPVSRDEVAFDQGVFLLTKAKSHALRAKPVKPPEAKPEETTSPTAPTSNGTTPETTGSGTAQPTTAKPSKVTVSLAGQIPSDQWNRVGTKLLPKLRSVGDVAVEIRLAVTVSTGQATGLSGELSQVLADLGLAAALPVKVENG